jgi:hypothetical protein
MTRSGNLGFAVATDEQEIEIRLEGNVDRDCKASNEMNKGGGAAERKEGSGCTDGSFQPAGWLRERDT